MGTLFYLNNILECLFPELNKMQQENRQIKSKNIIVLHFLYHTSRIACIIILLYLLKTINASNINDSISQLMQSLSQNYLNDIIVNQTTDFSKEQLQYNISSTKTGCQCQEQLYPFNCSISQLQNQNCAIVNPNQQIEISTFPFRKGLDLDYGLPIWILRGNSSPMDKLLNKKYQNGNCQENYKLCQNQRLFVCQLSNQSCPLSSFEMERSLQGDTFDNDPIVNRLRNTTSFISDLIVTNGSCSKQTQSIKQLDYILNDEIRYAKYPNNLKSIIQYKIKQMLIVNNQYKNYYENRPGLQEQNGTFEICSLSFDITEECSVIMLELKDDLLFYNNIIYIITIFQLVIFTVTFVLQLITYFKSQSNLIHIGLKFLEVLIIISTISLLIFNYFYNHNTYDNCWLIHFDDIIQGYIIFGFYTFSRTLTMIINYQNLKCHDMPLTIKVQQKISKIPNSDKSYSLHSIHRSSSNLGLINKSSQQ